MVIWVGSAPEVECVILMVAGTDTIGCYMEIEMGATLSLDLRELSLREPILSQPSFS